MNKTKIKCQCSKPTGAISVDQIGAEMFILGTPALHFRVSDCECDRCGVPLCKRCGYWIRRKILWPWPWKGIRFVCRACLDDLSPKN